MKTILAVLLLAFGLSSFAQSVGTTVKFNGTNKPALMLYLPYNEEVAAGTVLTKLKETGFVPESKGSLFWKQNKVDGYYVFKGVVLKTTERNELVDLYFKVDRRGNKRDSQSVIYMLTSKGAENFVNSMSEPQVYTAAQNFLNGFVTETATYKLTLDVQAQEENVKKAEKKLADLVTEEQELNKKITRLQEELAKNKQSQSNQQTAIEAEQRKLAEMRPAKPSM